MIRSVSFFLFYFRTSDYLTNDSTFRQDNVNKFLSENGVEYPHFNEILFEKYVKNLIDGQYIPAFLHIDTPVDKNLITSKFHK